MAADTPTSKPKLPPIAGGQRYGRLTVIERVGSQDGHSLWRFRCDCGTEITITANRARRRNNRSCGCLRREIMTRLGKSNTTHGLSRRPEHAIWSGMHQRCADHRHPTYASYGGRGITVCDRWQTFENFYADMGPRPTPAHTIDRKDNDRGYDPENCRWITRSQQSRNTSRNIIVLWRGQRMCLKDAAALTNISYNTVKERVRRGWTPERALSTPVRS